MRFIGIAAVLIAGLWAGQARAEMTAEELGKLCGEADLIVVTRTTEMSSKPGIAYTIDKVLKGDETGLYGGGGILSWEKGLEMPAGFGMKKGILFLRVTGDGVATPVVRPVRMKGWFVEDNEEMEKKVAAAIPMPKEWGKEANGLVMGVRLRKDTFKAGEELAVEIAIKNTGKTDVTIPQHRMNIVGVNDDYYPATTFNLDLGGNEWNAAKAAGIIDHEDIELKRTLKPGEVYIHTARLNDWPAQLVKARHEDTWTAKTAGEVFANGGTVELSCYYTGARPKKDDWAGTLVSNTVTVKTAEKAEAKGPGFGIYLVKDSGKGIGPGEAGEIEKKALGDLALEEKPIITEADIVTYDSKRHTMTLKKSLSVMPKETHLKYFVVAAGGERVYAGAFINPALSYRPAVAVVTLDAQGRTGKEMRIEAAYAWDNIDPRGDKRIMEALHKAGKLAAPDAMPVK